MKNFKLNNNNKIQVVSLKLDKTKPRELAFRAYLDQNESNGINRKETILRMFEQIMKQNNNIFDNEYQYKEDDTNDDKNNSKINTIKIKNANVKANDWNMI